MPDSKNFQTIRNSNYEKPIRWLLQKIEHYRYTAVIPRRVRAEMVLAVIPTNEHFCSAPVNDEYRVYGFETPATRDMVVQLFQGSAKIII